MSNAQQMLETHPQAFAVDGATIARCVDACLECAQTCTACADACLGEEMVAELAKCIRLNQDCADVCAAAGRIANRQTEYDSIVTRSILQTCAAICRSCGDECDSHAEMHAHCRICAASCRACEEACNALVAAFA